jgi:hypothetical protein
VLVCQLAVAGDVLSIATMLDAAMGSSRRPVGCVVLVATVATIGAHTLPTNPAQRQWNSHCPERPV